MAYEQKWLRLWFISCASSRVGYPGCMSTPTHAPISLFKLPALLTLTIPPCLSKHPHSPGLSSTQLRLGVGDTQTPRPPPAALAHPTSPFSQRTASCVPQMGLAAAGGPLVHPTGGNPVQQEQLALLLQILSTVTPTGHVPVCHLLASSECLLNWPLKSQMD